MSSLHSYVGVRPHLRVVELAILNLRNLNFDFSWQAEGKYKDDPVDLRLDIERRKKHKERDLKRGKSRESVDSRDSSHSRERSTEKTEKTHKGSKKQKYVKSLLPIYTEVKSLVHSFGLFTYQAFHAREL